MTRESVTGDRTHDSVRDRFRQWRDDNPEPHSDSALGLPIPELSDEAERLLALIVAVGLGLTLLALAAVCYTAAGSWARIDRGGAAVGYSLTAFFLTVAGLGAIFATLNHHFRVLTSTPEHH